MKRSIKDASQPVLSVEIIAARHHSPIGIDHQAVPWPGATGEFKLRADISGIAIHIPPQAEISRDHGSPLGKALISREQSVEGFKLDLISADASGQCLELADLSLIVPHDDALSLDDGPRTSEAISDLPQLGDVMHELTEIASPAVLRVGCLIHTVQGDLQLIQAGLDKPGRDLAREKQAIGVHFYKPDPFFFSVSNKLDNLRMEQGFSEVVDQQLLNESTGLIYDVIEKLRGHRGVYPGAPIPHRAYRASQVTGPGYFNHGLFWVTLSHLSSTAALVVVLR